VDGSTRYEVVNAMLLNGFLLVSDCVAIPRNPYNPRQKNSGSENFCNAGKNFPKEKVKANTYENKDRTPCQPCRDRHSAVFGCRTPPARGHHQSHQHW
jgi:hypothetical protein